MWDAIAFVLPLSTRSKRVNTGYTRLLRWAYRILGFFLWLCYGLAIALLIFALFGRIDVLNFLLPAIASVLLRIAAIIFFFLATAIIVESLR